MTGENLTALGIVAMTLTSIVALFMLALGKGKRPRTSLRISPRSLDAELSIDAEKPKNASASRYHKSGSPNDSVHLERKESGP